LTLVVRKHPVVPSIVTAGLDTVAIRVPAHPHGLALIRAAGRAIAAPSANPFGYVSPTRAENIKTDLSDQIDLTLDGGPCSVGVESTILSLVGPKPTILRAGGITAEALESVLGQVEWSTRTHDLPQAPGQMARHYATHTPLQLVSVDSGEIVIQSGEKVGLLSLKEPLGYERFAAVEVLSRSGNLREAAANLFSALQHLDGLNLDRLVATAFPEEGLGVAIMDRLRRCSARRRL
jgi:L-threonylcarbamoyladenylate synthase